jgi:mRNA interferase MazF
VLLPDGLEIAGAVLSDQVKSLDFRARDARFVCKAPSEVLERVQCNVGALTGA